MSSASVIKASTPLSTISSVDTNHTGASNTTATNTAQNGPYTKAQFQTTMEGSRTIRNSKEVEQLLRDYPAALELYRTGRYKVKLKYEADVERVILVERRTNKDATNNQTKTDVLPQNTQPVPNVSMNLQKPKDDTNKENVSEQQKQINSRAESKDHTASKTSLIDNSPFVQTATSSMHMTSNTQPKVDNHRAATTDQEAPDVPQEKKHRSRHRNKSHDSSTNVVPVKTKGKRSSRDYPQAVVPYVANVNPAPYMWQQPQSVQHYFSNPVLPQQQVPMSNGYMQQTYLPQQNQIFQQPYYYGQTTLPALTYQKPSVYSTPSTTKGLGGKTDRKSRPKHNHSSSSQVQSNLIINNTIPPVYNTYYPNQQQYLPPQTMYQPQVQFPMPGPWPTMIPAPTGPYVNHKANIYVDNQQGMKNRTRSVDPAPRTVPQYQFYNQPQEVPVPPKVEYHHHQHHHRHRRTHATNVQVNATAPVVETVPQQNIAPQVTVPPANNGNNVEKLTIRQLNDLFVQNEPSGRLSYNAVPNVLQRFGISLGETDLTSAARQLEYNTNEPISARRLVHILMKLGKIAKSTQPPNPYSNPNQQRIAASPVMLPEDREVTDIMTHSRTNGVTSTHIHSAAHPNHWY